MGLLFPNKICRTSMKQKSQMIEKFFENINSPKDLNHFDAKGLSGWGCYFTDESNDNTTFGEKGNNKILPYISETEIPNDWKVL